MQKKTSFLDFHAKKGTGFLHPGGISMTNVLIKEIDPKKGLNILEIGCGTGATTVQLAKYYTVNLIAVDESRKMLKSAKQRAWFNKVADKIQFIQISNQGKLPFEDNTFDVVYAESVLGIITPTQLTLIIQEITRVLKPNGKFICNDAIWKDTTDKKMVDQINTNCIRDFGIVQSTASPAYKDEWIHFFKNENLQLIKVIDKDEMKTTNSRPPKKDGYWLYKTALCVLNPFFLAQKMSFDKALKTTHIDDGKFLKSFLFVLVNIKLEKSKIPESIV